MARACHAPRPTTRRTHARPHPRAPPQSSALIQRTVSGFSGNSLRFLAFVQASLAPHGLVIFELKEKHP
jgi:hypothetical protein